MKIALRVLFFVTILAICWSRAIPDDKTPSVRNPSMEYEWIGGQGGGAGVFNKPPVEENSNKTFIYNPKTGSWRVQKAGEATPEEGTLQWNQSSDKWLTQAFRY